MNWKSILQFRLIGVILALALSVAIPVGYVAAAEIGSLIKTDDGYVSGTMIGDVGKRCVFSWDPLCRSAGGGFALETTPTGDPLEGYSGKHQVRPLGPANLPYRGLVR